MLFAFSTLLVSVEDYFRKDREKKLLNSANIIAGSIAKMGYFTNLVDEPKRQVLNNYLDEKSREGYRVLVMDNRLTVLNDSNNTEVNKTLFIPEVVNAIKKKNDVRLRKGEETVYASASIEAGQNVVGAVLLVAAADDIFLTMTDIRSDLLLFTVLMSLVLAVLVFFASQLLIDPLRNVLKVVQKMSEGYLNERINVTGHDEYSQLGDAFNDMAQKLEKVDKTREEFVSNVSHELKTPLSSMKVLSESLLLQDGVPEEMYREFLQDIVSEIDRMTHIVNDLLNLVKLDQGAATMLMKPTEINSMVEEILKRMYPLAQKKNIDLVFEDVRNVTVNCDEVKLDMALSNLIDNGIKYTPQNGTVKVIVDADHKDAVITIKDTGIGISEDDQPKIFERFYRVDKTRDRETGGTGLGLAITHNTVLWHNGSIRLQSNIGEGTTFIVRIPLSS